MDDDALRRLIRESPIPDRLLEDLRKAPLVHESAVNHYRPNRKQTLTPAEKQSLELRSHGMTLSMIAETRHVSVRTVSSTLTSARYNLGAKDLLHAVALAIRQGLID